MGEDKQDVYILIGRTEFKQFRSELLTISDINDLFPNMNDPEVNITAFSPVRRNPPQYNAIVGLYESKKKNFVSATFYDFNYPQMNEQQVSDEMKFDGTLEKLLEMKFKGGNIKVPITKDKKKSTGNYLQAPEASLMIYLSPSFAKRTDSIDYCINQVINAKQKPVVVWEVEPSAQPTFDLGIGNDWRDSLED